MELEGVDMTSLTSFADWLATLPPLGYDRDWIRRNEPALRQRFEQTGGAAMPPCPRLSIKPRDRYEEL